MRSAATRWTTLLLLMGVVLALVWRHHRARAIVLPAAAMQGEPRLMLWAWETPEDLTALDPAKAGVAFLSREILLGDMLQIRPRRQPLRVNPKAWLMAVVRIETAPGFVPAKADAKQIAQNIVAATDAPQVHALQIDFDAAASQRALYADVLREVRVRLPAGYPLSITALASWCGSGSWLHRLAANSIVDEAVPMFFRMGGPAATRATTARSTAVIAESLCASSVGVATDEVWPGISPKQRAYVFRSGSWNAEDIANANAKGYEGLKGSSPR